MPFSVVIVLFSDVISNVTPPVLNVNVNVTAYFTLDGVQYKATSTVAVSGQNEATVPTKTIKVMAYGTLS